MESEYCAQQWAFAWGGVLGSCDFKTAPEDFIVEESLSFEPCGDGEHEFLLIEKRGENTDWLAGQIARFAGVGKNSVGYAGRKDRHGITSQWFSVWLPGRSSPDWRQFGGASVRILKSIRHQRKLKTGAVKSNRFHIRLRNVDVSEDLIERRMSLISQKGVPNYFGEQRFGHDGGNLLGAVEMFENSAKISRNRRSMYLSAARSWLFNSIVSGRVSDGTWLRYASGDVPGFRNNGSLLLSGNDDGVTERINQGDVSLTAPLWGAGELLSSFGCRDYEQSVADRYRVFSQGLENSSLKQERRVMRLLPTAVNWLCEGGSLILDFSLPPGCYATALLRELFSCSQPRSV